MNTNEQKKTQHTHKWAIQAAKSILRKYSVVYSQSDPEFDVPAKADDVALLIALSYHQLSSTSELLEVAVWHRDMLDLGDVAFYERHGFNVSEVMPRTRAAIAKATGEGKQ